ncbi:MAG: hypothetical protein ACMUHB_01450 [Thermoplasmatota archaeon]
MKLEITSPWVLLPVLVLLTPGSLAVGERELAPPDLFEGAPSPDYIPFIPTGYTELFSDGTMGFTAETGFGRIMLGESSIEYFVRGPEGTETMTLYFEGAHPVSPEGRQELPGKTSYLMNGDNDIIGARSFEQVVYEDLWDGIDLVFGFRGEDPKYEFVVRPGAEIDHIEVRVSGAEKLYLHKGELVMRTPGGSEVRDTGLLASYLDDGSRLEASFKISSESSFIFDIPGWDSHRGMLIDPVISSTYLGGNDEEMTGGITVDDEGFIYVVSSTFSLDFPREVNPILSVEGIQDAMVTITKFEPDLSDVVFTTIFGGIGAEEGWSLAVDGNGRIWMAGYTTSDDLQVTRDAIQKEKDGSEDGFIVCLSSDGSSIVYCSYFGGSDEDYITRIAALPDGSIIVGGVTNSRDGRMMATDGALDISDDGYMNYDIIVSRIFPGVPDPIYTALLGSPGDDLLFDLKVDEQLNVYLSGTTDEGFPITEGSTGGDDQDIFIAKIDPTGSFLRFSARVGGHESSNDASYCLEILEDGSAIIAGRANSITFPGRPHVSSYTSLGFVLKIDPEGKAVIFSEVMDFSSGFFNMDIDGKGRICLVGYSTSREHVKETNGAVYADPGDDGTGLVLVLSPEDLEREYLGTLGDEIRPESVEWLDDGTLLIYGDLYYDNLPPGTDNVYDATHNGDQDLFLLIMDLHANPLPPTNLTVTTGYRKAYISWVQNANETLQGTPTYEVYRTERYYSYRENDWELVGVVSGQESYIDDEVEFEYSYYYRVVTRYGSNVSRPTENLRVYISPSVPAPVFVEAKVENGTVTLRWEVPEPDYSEHIKGFVIRRGSMRDDYAEVFENIRADDRTWTDRWVDEGTTYTYNIEAELLAYSYSDPEESQRSDTLSVRVPYGDREEVEVEDNEEWTIVIVVTSVITFIILASAAVVLYLLPAKREEGPTGGLEE